MLNSVVLATLIFLILESALLSLDAAINDKFYMWQNNNQYQMEKNALNNQNTHESNPNCPNFIKAHDVSPIESIINIP